MIWGHQSFLRAAPLPLAPCQGHFSIHSYLAWCLGVGKHCWGCLWGRAVLKLLIRKI